MRHENLQRRRTIERVVANLANHPDDFCGNRIALLLQPNPLADW